MGILFDSYEEERNILTDHGFLFKNASDMHLLSKCYERKIHIPTGYYIYISVKPRTKQVYVTAECLYDRKIEPVQYEHKLENNWSDSPSDFFKELDDYVTGITDKCKGRHNRKEQQEWEY